MSEVIIQYHDFHPTEFTRAYMDTKVGKIHEQAPYGSTVYAVVTRESARIKATLKIVSSAGTFFAAAQGTRLKPVCKRALGRIHRQLEKWKTIRFQNRNFRRGGENNGPSVA